MTAAPRSPSSSPLPESGPVTANRRLASLDHGGAQRLHDLVGRGLGHLDQREPLVDLDGPDVAALQPGLAGDRADEVPRPDPGVPADADEQPSGRTTPGGTTGRTLGSA